MPDSRDLRAYIEALKEIGEIQEIDREVDLDLEVGANSGRIVNANLGKYHIPVNADIGAIEHIQRFASKWSTPPFYPPRHRGDRGG